MDNHLKKADTTKEKMKATLVKTEETKPAVAKKQASKKFLEKVPETMAFWCHDGQVFADLEQLMLGFDLMSDETFIFHANEGKNDFSCWIIDVIGDKELAQDIKKAKNKTEAKKITQKRHNGLKSQPT